MGLARSAHVSVWVSQCLGVSKPQKSPRESPLPCGVRPERPTRAATVPSRPSRPVRRPSRASDPCGDRPEPSVPTRAASVPTRAAQQQLRIESSKRHLQTITYVFDMCIICISIDYNYRPYSFVLSLITVACTARHGRKTPLGKKGATARC